MKRINRKYPYIHPGRKRGHSAHLAIYLDQSGSVSDSDIALLFGELNNLASRRQIDLFNFDTEVDEKSKVTLKRGRTAPPLRTRCGGTNFSAPMKHIDDNKSSYDGMIILTDGEACDPGPPLRGVRRCWVITPGCKLLFTPHSTDTVITLEWPKGEA